MMSVPAINSVLPPSGSQPAKINSSPTATPSVSPLGLSVPSKLSVIPPPQISTNVNKPPIGLNHSSVPLSLVFENKVIASQSSSSLPKPSVDKPKDLSPIKPTSNGVEISSVKTTSPTQQTSSTAQSGKLEEALAQQATTNHSEERIPLPSNEPASLKCEEPTQNLTSQLQNVSSKKVEQNSNQNVLKEEENKSLSEQKDPMAENEDSEEAKAEVKASQPNKRKREQKLQEKKDDEPEPEKKSRRIRSQVLPYQSPLPEFTTFINKSLKEKDASQKNNEEKLIVFYKNEFLAVRNAEGSFYLCQTLQNVYRSSHRIRIRWLSQKKESSNDDGDVYTPDFYDLTDFECILTTVALSKMDKNMYKLPKVELERIENILKRALDVEKGVTEKPSITEEHPDGIDLSLYKDESQLQKPKKAAKRKRSLQSRKTPKQAKKDQSGEEKSKMETTKKPKGKSRSRGVRKVTKTVLDKSRSMKRGGGRSESSKSLKSMDQLKVSPPNEKARVVAKVLRKVDIVPAKEILSKRPAKSKTAKRLQEVVKSQKKKPQRNIKKSGFQKGGKEEPASSHHERRQGKNKYLISKNKKN